MEQKKRTKIIKELNELGCGGTFEEHNKDTIQNIGYKNKGILWHRDIENIMKFVEDNRLRIYIKRKMLIIHG